jgi:septal ring factor EnvC (AmiA/AmiB activator)
MKPHICSLMLIGILGVTPLCYAQTEKANTSIEDVKKESQDLLQTIGSYTADQRDEAVEKAKQGLDRLDRRIDTLEARIDKNWDKRNAATRKEARENLKALRKQRNQVAEWYGSMKTSSADAWKHMKKGFSDAYKDLEDAWEKSEKEFSSEE